MYICTHILKLAGEFAVNMELARLTAQLKDNSQQLVYMYSIFMNIYVCMKVLHILYIYLMYLYIYVCINVPIYACYLYISLPILHVCTYARSKRGSSQLKDCTHVHITYIYSEIGGRLRVAQRASAAHGTTQGHFAKISQPRKQN